ncbi:enhanced serine sensitivity protein SseB C-terminal domain-containing protein [Tumebacillus permanentifrigoris]|uniref:Type III secretion system (T3SS) SseB-like protein n=1 Tax=Tumebacillus permanentifrigoris TaxID=378543 RepID=A0A316D3H5_9BACL|nr:enhanced serine sensitivity protein SseB C-terminal domain-containing protein [Tumebacillus permanentifrigoris]PWK05649.1 type III secretion system (T3SS) SseB-like protein [Tumebacillus permanentifrigoris]
MTTPPLTHHLQQAKQTPALRSDFYRALWAAELYFIGQTDSLSYYEANGRTLLPCFSSLELLQSVVPADETYVLLPAHEVFPNIPAEITVVLNPFTAVGKEFDSLERRALMEGILFERPPAQADTSEQILFGQPAEMPDDLIETLRAFFKKHSAIHTAYLGQICIPSTGIPPHPLVGLYCPAISESLFLELALDMQAQADTPLEVYRLTLNDKREIARYLLNETTPIYSAE